MATNQPKWKFVDNLGDASPLDYGGYFVFVDETGVYSPEAELLEVDNEHETDDSKLRYTVYRFVLEPCTYINGILSDNPFHPSHPAWFAKPEKERHEHSHDTTYLSVVAEYCDTEVEKLICSFCSHDPCERAHAWHAVGMYHGYENLDSYPLHLSRKEAEERYKEILK